jgi:hypothetical protein
MTSTANQTNHGLMATRVRGVMKRLFRSALCASMTAALCGAAAATALLTTTTEAQAQEIQLTGPLAGAPAVRELRLRREGRFEIAPSVSFTLLDEYRRTIMPGVRLTYHPFDWLGLGAWGGYGFQYNTGLTDELQEKAIDSRNCTANPSAPACRLTAVNLTRGDLAEDQLGGIKFIAAPQITLIPFRGKLSLFSALFVDTDVSIFLGGAIIGLDERQECGFDSDGAALTPCSDPSTFQLESRITGAPTFGLGLNFYPANFVGFGFEYRALPFAWNTSGFDNFGGGPDEEFPDNAVNSDDRSFQFTSLLTVGVSFQLPAEPQVSE